MRLLYFSSSVNLFFKRACTSFTAILDVCKQRRLWRDCADVGLTWAFAGRLCDKYHNFMSWLICCICQIHVRTMKESHNGIMKGQMSQILPFQQRTDKMLHFSFQQFMSTYDNMPLIGDELQQGQNGNFNVPGPQVMPPQGPYQGAQPMQPHSRPPPLYRFNHQNQGFNSQPPPMYNMNSSGNYPQQQVGYNANHTYQQPQGFNNQSQQVIMVCMTFTL